MQVSAATAALIEKLRRIQAAAHKREHPPRAETDVEEPARDVVAST